jgi:hypothetical protein
MTLVNLLHVEKGSRIEIAAQMFSYTGFLLVEEKHVAYGYCLVHSNALANFQIWRKFVLFSGTKHMLPCLDLLTY